MLNILEEFVSQNLEVILYIPLFLGSVILLFIQLNLYRLTKSVEDLAVAMKAECERHNALRTQVEQLTNLIKDINSRLNNKNE
jgi:hypothetical protein